MPSPVRAIALLLTVVTGFSGLAYEVAWQRYLATLLGAHSEATAAVLAIFLGGLSVGYALFGLATRRLVVRARASGRPPPLLACYGLVEAAIGAYALLFPWLFRGAQQLSLWLPTGGGLVAFGADVALAAALIAPPAVLMGGTIPILTQALARSLEDATRLHALVYALNTAGAFAGALAAGFALVPWLGLDGVARAMGTLNLCAGASFVLLGALRREIVPQGSPAADAQARVSGVYSAAALLVGFAMMTWQTTLIRIGGLTLGSSEFTFTMVVAAFVLGIAAGSLTVSALPRIGRMLLPGTLWALAFACGFLYLHADDAPYWGHVLRSYFRDNEQAFSIYYTAAFLATLLLIGPAVALGGAVLPLLFHAVREEMGDLGAKAGRLYSQNTIGSLLGALLGGYALLFWLDLHHVYRVGLCALALAAALVSAQLTFTRRLAGTVAWFLPALLIVLALPSWRPERLASGTFRTRQPQPWTYAGPDSLRVAQSVVFYDDDPTSSVAVVGRGRDRAIIVNGKSDGSTRGDLHTMALAALVPALFAERAERAFVIGFGTGITAGYLAALDETRAVTVAEISSAVLQAAPHFDSANFAASQHPKVETVRSDAYRALLRTDEVFDVIVSEPSNPWVAGTEMLFSREFLRAARDRLSARGIYVQWYHGYENDDRTVELVLQTFAEVFDDLAVWQSQGWDLLLLGMKDPSHALDVERLEQRARQPDFAAALSRLGIDSLPALLVHERLPLGVVHAAGPAGIPVHTLYHPRLSYQAARAFYSGREGELPFSGYGEPARLGRQNSLLLRYLRRAGGEIPEAEWDAMINEACATKLPHCATLVAAWASGASEESTQRRIAELRGRSPVPMGFDLVPAMRSFFTGVPPAGRQEVTPRVAMRQTKIFLNRYYHGMPFPPESLVAVWRSCRERREGGTACQEGLRAAEQVVSGRPPPEAWK